MIKLINISTPVTAPPPDIKKAAAILRLSERQIRSVKLYRRSVDARKKPEVCFCDTLLVELSDPKTEANVLKHFQNAAPFRQTPYVWKKAARLPAHRPVIVGSGPAGLFAALTLCRAGIKPLILEQGQPVEQRAEAVEHFWATGRLNPASNVQFGEGGAGTFSDGKLNTGIKDPRCRTVLETFHSFGADPDILIQAKPHIGTDVLRKVVKNMREEITRLGGEYRFGTRFTEPMIKNGRLCAIRCEDDTGTHEIPCEDLILAIGNAARQTVRTLYAHGVEMTAKPFAIGMRIEHSQEMLNRSQYGESYPKELPPCEYKQAVHLPSGRGVYTFCMCPGGVVVNAASEENTVVTNGMSYKSRDGRNANSAILVGIDERDFDDGTPFGGILLQEQIERAAFALTGGGAPVQTVGTFLKTHTGAGFSSVLPTVRPAPTECDLSKLFPRYITDSIRQALPLFDRKIKGFCDGAAVLTAPETRSSSPVRILRDKTFCSNIAGIYPCGEGAGYAGGITSSAVDGIRCAEQLIERFSEG